jgi:hypothetical protein
MLLFLYLPSLPELSPDAGEIVEKKLDAIGQLQKINAGVFGKIDWGLSGRELIWPNPASSLPPVFRLPIPPTPPCPNRTASRYLHRIKTFSNLRGSASPKFPSAGIWSLLKRIKVESVMGLKKGSEYL